MNNNETSILPHTITLPLVQRADQLVDDHLKRTGDQLSSTGILLTVIETVSDCCFEVELRITSEGYVIAFPQDRTVDDLLDAIARGFEVQEEILAEDDDF
ncbi:hypothetical protein SEA_INDYLU_37 [Microbacterium phage IndyLu]|uniref:hypothetical protein n=1 Tax=Microbacterium phage IndyLu TaxID=2885152 RepID=UPI001E7B793A|nr:hypothetical protein QDW27_gp37 [Microbacterium phage IndyLu]UDG78739.1 hypothetical protein SEA_INDYLU_37 [Microbacterium phage IndyLu]